MKTKKQTSAVSVQETVETNSELQIRAEQSGKTQDKTAKAQPEKTSIDFAERERNRQLPLDAVLAKLQSTLPRQYELAEVVGQWIWITLPESPDKPTRAALSQLGFHWNSTRQCWQHPCGQTLPRGIQNPREKYTTYFPADLHPDAANPHLYNGPARTAEQVAA